MLNRVICVDGLALPLSEWAERLGVSYQCIQKRIKCGWSEKEAVTRSPRRKVVHDRIELGEKFGYWTVIRDAEVSKGQAYICRCRCGRTSVVYAHNLWNGRSTKCSSCGVRESWHKRKNIIV